MVRSTVQSAGESVSQSCQFSSNVCFCLCCASLLPPCLILVIGIYSIKTVSLSIRPRLPSALMCAVTSVCACICTDGRLSEVTLAPRPWLEFRSTEKPGHMWVCLDYHCDWPRRPATFACEATVRSSGTRGSDQTQRATEVERGGKLDLTEDGDYIWTPT